MLHELRRLTLRNQDELVIADQRVITTAQSDEEDHLIELVWRESLPLGMNLLLNDDSGRLKVVDFPRGSQARAVCTEKGIDPEVFKGATIVAVNGTQYELQEDLFGALKDPGRPKAIRFELADPADAERVKRFVENSKAKNSGKLQNSTSADSTERLFYTRDVTITQNVEIGLEFGATNDDRGLVVKAFVPGAGGTVLAAERDGNIQVGDLLTHVNGKLVLGENGEGRRKAFELLGSDGQRRPLKLTFSDPYLFRVEFEKEKNSLAQRGGPTEFVMMEKDKRIVLHNFDNVSGAAESGGILIGDHLVFINGVPVGAGCKMSDEGNPPELSEVYSMLRNENSYPIALTFARPKQGGSRWTTPSKQTLTIQSVDTICITAESFTEIGCVVEGRNVSDVVVTDLFAVPGSFQKDMKGYMDTQGNIRLSVEELNGQFVPSYATPSIVTNALARSWASNGKVEVLFCDDERKEWIQGLK